MDPPIVALVLLSAFLHAAWNALLKRDASPARAASVVAGVAAAASAVCAVVPLRPAFPRHEGIAWAVASGALEGGYFVTLAQALRRAPLGVAYAASRGSAIALVWPASVLCFGERADAPALLGTVLIAAGLLAMGVAPGRGIGRPGAGWAFACGAFIAGYHLCYKRGLATGASPAALSAVSLGVAFPINAVVRRLHGADAHDPPMDARRVAILVLAGLVSAASFLLFLAALAKGGAGATLTLRNTSIVFAVALGWLLGERPRPWHWAGIALTIAGVAAFAVPR